MRRRERDEIDFGGELLAEGEEVGEGACVEEEVVRQLKAGRIPEQLLGLVLQPQNGLTGDGERPSARLDPFEHGGDSRADGRVGSVSDHPHRVHPFEEAV